jgi:hypothetical protein
VFAQVKAAATVAEPGEPVWALVARYYDPTTATFLTRDPIEDLTGQPYQYADGDPIDETDPTGLGCGWTSQWDCHPSLQQTADWAAGFGDTVTFGAPSR